MATSINKAIKEITETLKKENFPGTKALTYWEKLSSEFAGSGSWKNETLDAVTSQIEKWLQKLDTENWTSLLDSSDTSAQYIEDSTNTNKELVSELARELLDYILDQFDSELADDIYIDDPDIEEDLLDDDDFEDFDDFDDDDFTDIKY